MPDLPEGKHAVSAEPEQRRLTTWQQIAISLYWFSTSAHWSAILIILLQMQAAGIGGEAKKGTTLGIIVLAGAFVSMVAAPVFGAWSDRVHTRLGRRRPFLIAGTVGNILGLLVLAFLPAQPGALLPYILAFCWVQFFNNLATAPYAALIPDVVPPAQRGSASGWMGLMTMLGNAVGVGIGLAMKWIGGLPGAYILLAVIMLLGMLGTVLLVREPKPKPAPPFDYDAFRRGLVEPFRSRDFLWVFLTRLLVMLGIFTVQEFLQFYFKDVVAGGQESFPYQLFGRTLATEAHEATSFFALALLVGAIVSSVAAGALSDRHGRKKMVYLSGLLQGIVVIIFLFTGRFDVVVLIGLIFGLGYGAYMAVDWALVTDVLPKADDYAKDMGLWHIAATLPQVTAAPIAGILLDTFQRVGKSHGLPTLGYTVIFALAFVYFALGTVLVSRIKGAR
ncbi:MAG: MFS transporter [Armatimonadota bacterium]